VVGVEPLQLVLGEQRDVEQLPLERDDGEVLEAEVVLAAEAVLRLDLLKN
jgi:hypothetical protein